MLKYNATIPEVQHMYNTLRLLAFPVSSVYPESLTLDQCFEVVMNRLNLTRRLRDLQITKSDIPMLATEAMKQTRLLPNNPREVKYENMIDLYTQAY